MNEQVVHSYAYFDKIRQDRGVSQVIKQMLHSEHVKQRNLQLSDDTFMERLNNIEKAFGGTQTAFRNALVRYIQNKLEITPPNNSRGTINKNIRIMQDTNDLNEYVKLGYDSLVLLQ